MIGNEIANRLERGLKVERKARDTGDLEKASSVLAKIRDILSDLDEDDALPYWTRVYYETAHIAKLNGKADEAIEAFELNAKFADRGGDAPSALNARYHAMLMRYLSGEVAPPEAYRFFLDVVSKIDAMLEEDGNRRSSLEGMKQNLVTRLCDLSFENGSADFHRWNAVYEEDPHTKLFRLQGEPRYDLAILRNEGRAAYMSGDYTRAAAIFSAYLDVDRSIVPAPPDIRNLAAITSFFQNSAEETARDYRDAGRAYVLALGDEGKEIARHIWRQGLKLKDDIGNRRYLADMKAELEALENG